MTDLTDSENAKRIEFPKESALTYLEILLLHVTVFFTLNQLNLVLNFDLKLFDIKSNEKKLLIIKVHKFKIKTKKERQYSEILNEIRLK